MRKRNRRRRSRGRCSRSSRPGVYFTRGDKESPCRSQTRDGNPTLSKGPGCPRRASCQCLAQNDLAARPSKSVGGQSTQGAVGYPQGNGALKRQIAERKSVKSPSLGAAKASEQTASEQQRPNLKQAGRSMRDATPGEGGRPYLKQAGAYGRLTRTGHENTRLRLC